MTTTYLPASFTEAVMAIAEGKHVEFKLSDRPEFPWRTFTGDTWVRLADMPKYIWRIAAQDEQAQLIEQLQAELGRLRAELNFVRTQREDLLQERMVMSTRIFGLQAQLQAAQARGIRALRFFGG